VTAHPRNGRPATGPGRSVARDDASMLALEIALAITALASALLLAFAR
jgi:hypothetical protein